MEPKIDPLAEDAEALRKSREKVLAIARWIIPGHGSMFEVKPQ
jgi:glyoxylase-like metal-dependent hydrolase (beta-lactamase superfamily II)